MFRKGLEEEFNTWLDNTEFNEEIFNKVNDLTDVDKNYIIDNVLNDDMLSQEIFNSFEWYLNKYLEIKGSNNNEKDSTL